MAEDLADDVNDVMEELADGAAPSQAQYDLLSLVPTTLRNQAAEITRLRAGLNQAISLLDEPSAIRKAAGLVFGGTKNRMLAEAQEIEDLQRLARRQACSWRNPDDSCDHCATPGACNGPEK